MIQRIQTVYMLLGAILSGLLLILPIADIVQNGSIYEFTGMGVVDEAGAIEKNGLPATVLIGLITLLHMTAIFLFRKRLVQRKIMVFSIVLLLGLLGLFYFFTWFSYIHAEISFRLYAVFPLLVIILDVLAIRGISKDEKLVRSIDRIR